MSAYVVGIAGGSASGKSTLVSNVQPILEATGLKVVTVGLDSYFWQEMSQSPTVDLPSGRTYFNRNLPESANIDALLKDTRRQMEVADVLLLEGHFVLVYPEVRRLLDLAVFVHLDADVRALRRLMRDQRGGRGDTDATFIVEYFLASAKPGHDRFIEPSKEHADVILRGDADPSRTARLLASTINGELACRGLRTNQ